MENMTEQNKQKFEASKQYIGVFLTNIVAVPNVNITCDIVNPEELTNIKIANEKGQKVVLVSSKDGIAEPTINDFFEIGCLCEIKKFVEEEGHTKVLLLGQSRVLINKIESLQPQFVLYAQELPEVNANSVFAYQKMNILKDELKKINYKTRFLPPMLENQLLNLESSPAKFSDALIHLLAKEDIKTQPCLLRKM